MFAAVVRTPLSLAAALIALAVLAPGAAAATQKIVPLGPDPAWGCITGTTIPRLDVRSADGTLVSPGFRLANRRLTQQIKIVSRRLKSAKSPKRLRAQRRRLIATRAGVGRCRAGALPAPAASRRSFAFACLHGVALPTVLIRGSCAVDLRPRGIPEGKARAAYALARTYGTLDRFLFPECGDEDGSFQGPEDMESLLALYLVRCSPGESEAPLPASSGWGILGMDVDNCDEILAADENGCGPSNPRPPSNPSPAPRDPPSQPQGDCIVLRMETENPDC
jgi:hypothetical protein